MSIFLVTGGCGFIGSHLAAALVESGARVRILDNLSSGYESNLAGFRDRIEFIKGDICDFQTVREAVTGVDYVFHEAALVSVFESVDAPLRNHEINLSGLMHVLEAAHAAGVKRLVFASSSAVYGNDPALPKCEDMLPQPASPYAVAKLTGEHLLRVYSELYKLQTVALRYFNVYGPRQDPSSMYSGVISKFADVLLQDESPVIFGDGLQTRDFVYVKDVVAANLAAMYCDTIGHGEVFNIGTGNRTSLLDLLQVLQDLSGNHRDVIFRDARPGDIRHSQPDIRRAREILGFTPEFGLREGLAALITSKRCM